MSTHSEWQGAVWRQFGAAIDMLEHAIQACPPGLWAEPGRGLEFWRLAYHTLFWLDYYSADAPDAYRPPAPFTLDELDPAAAPARVYTPAELLQYLGQGRARCRTRVAAMSAEVVGAPSAVPRLGVTAGELLALQSPACAAWRGPAQPAPETGHR